MENTPPLPPKAYTKPAWLVKLEEESWQAELIISGAAIFGTLQLPDLVNQLEDYVLLTINREALLFWSMVVLFLRLLATVLIGTFLIHFVLRTLWIGILGINSAYPGGFKANKRFSQDYQAKLKAKFGDIDGYIQQLDRVCSSIFGGGFSLALVSVGWAAVIVVIGLLFYWLRDLVPHGLVQIVGLVLFCATILASAISMIMSLPRNHEKAWAKRWHFPLTMGMSKVLFNIGFRPANIITNIFSSHIADQKNAFSLTFMFMIGIGFLSGMLSGNTGNAKLFYDHYYHRVGNDTTRIMEHYYADQIPIEEVAFFPLIPSIQVSSDALFTVFIPLPNRELFLLESQCNQPPISTVLVNPAKRQASHARFLACSREYLEISINGKVINEYTLKRHWRGSQEQFGLLAIISQPNLTSGQNQLNIRTQYLNEDGQAKEVIIPFFLLSKPN